MFEISFAVLLGLNIHQIINRFVKWRRRNNKFCPVCKKSFSDDTYRLIVNGRRRHIECIKDSGDGDE